MREYTLFLTFYTPLQRNLPVSVPVSSAKPNMDKVFTILNFMSRDFDAVHLVGGEPFILPTFNDILDFAVDRYSKIYIETMGTGDVFRAAYNIRQHISEGADIEVRINMLDMDPSVADKYIGAGSWEAALSAASLFKATFDIDPKIVMYIGSHSTHNYRLLAELGFDIILRRAYGMKVTEKSVAAMYQLAEYDQVTVEDCVYSAIHGKSPCVEPKYVIDFDGNIYLNRYNPIKEMQIGSIFGKTMEELTSLVEEYYEHLQNVKLTGKCARCAYAEICMGGDYLFWPSLDEANDQACPIREEAVAELEQEEEPEEEEYADESYIEENEDQDLDEMEPMTEEEFIESLED